MELTIETIESELRSLRDWLAAEDGLGSTRVKWKPAEPRPGEMGGAADVLVVALGAGGAGTVVANSIATWIKYRSRDLKLKITTADRLMTSRSLVSGCSMFECVDTAETALVTARAKGDDARTRAIAFWMREAAMSSIAFVIFLVV